MTIFAVVDAIKKADAPWAWVDLAADVVSLAVPFATGGGTVVKAVSKADDVLDLVKTADWVTDTADTVYDGVKAMSKVDIPDCFVAGTMIATEEGHLPIEDIKVGDHVWATDPETGVTDLRKAYFLPVIIVYRTLRSESNAQFGRFFLGI